MVDVLSMMLIFYLLMSRVNAQEEATPASFLGPRDFNHHAYEGQYLKEVTNIEPTKQGPILFPNDAPPPPRPPLIVTSRPLIESIARSELNNTVASETQEYLTRVKEYQPVIYPAFTPRVDRYDYEDHSSLPPFYRAIADRAKEKAVALQNRDSPQYDYHVKVPDYINRATNHVDDYDDDGNQGEYTKGKKYAFSYTVRDQKTGDDFSHSQHSSGSATNGEYRVRLPDGRMQIVSYTADENGYKADVRYDDEDKTSLNSIDNHNHNLAHINNNNRNVNSHDEHFRNKLIDFHNNNKRNHNDIANTNVPNANVHNHNDNLHNHNVNEHNHIDNSHSHNDKLYNEHLRNQIIDFHNNDKQYHINIANNQYNENDYIQQREYKPVEEKSTDSFYNQYTDLSKEYYNEDYSLEFGKDYGYEPHQSKFQTFNKNPVIVAPQKGKFSFKPQFDKLKPIFISKKLFNKINPKHVEVTGPSSTPNSDYQATTEHVVLITNKPANQLYTDIKSSIAPYSPISYTTESNFVSPKSYLESTISSLKDRVDLSGPKPVLSNSFIEKINKYLGFK